MGNSAAFLSCTDSSSILVSGRFCHRDALAYWMYLSCTATLAVPTSSSYFRPLFASWECLNRSGTYRYYSCRADPFCRDLCSAEALELGLCVISIGDTIEGLSGNFASPV